MRGRRTFAKHIERSPSGGFRWSVIDALGSSLASGISKGSRQAIYDATTAERRLFREFPDPLVYRKSKPRDGSR